MYMIREKGRNGGLTITPDALVRTIHEKEEQSFWVLSNRKDSTVSIPLGSISSVSHHTRRFSTDKVVVATSVDEGGQGVLIGVGDGKAWKWKVANAELFVEELNQALVARS